MKRKANYHTTYCIVHFFSQDSSMDNFYMTSMFLRAILSPKHIFQYSVTFLVVITRTALSAQRASNEIMLLFQGIMIRAGVRADACSFCTGGTMGKEDIKLKAYLEDARRYADLWNGSVFSGEQMLKPEELQVVSPVLAKAYGEDVLEKTRDLVMMQSGTGQYFAVYAVENQENIDYSMPARIMLQEVREGNEGMCRALEEWKADCKAEGKIEGRIESKVEDIIELLEDYGEVSDELKNKIFLQNDLTLLKRWHKLAAHAGSIEEFVNQINNNI